MKKTELKNLKTKNLKDLEKFAKDKKLEIAKVLVKIASGQEKNLKKAKNLRRELAQTLTIIKEMGIVQKLQKVVEEEKVVKVTKTKK